LNPTKRILCTQKNLVLNQKYYYFQNYVSLSYLLILRVYWINLIINQARESNKEASMLIWWDSEEDSFTARADFELSDRRTTYLNIIYISSSSISSLNSAPKPGFSVNSISPLIGIGSSLKIFPKIGTILSPLGLRLINSLKGVSVDAMPKL